MLALTLEGSNDFQQRVPNPTINGMSASVDAIFDPYNNDLYNAFTKLLNGIMMTYVYSRRFENPLRSMKQPTREFGNVERRVAVDYLKAHTYGQTETLLKSEIAKYEEWFFSVNYRTRYEFSWPRADLKRAFAEDGYGFNELLAATLDAQISSDQYDEMNTMIQMFAEAEGRWGLFKVDTNIPTDKSSMESLAVAIRTYANRFKFPSKYYNAIDVPCFETPETLVLWVTPEIDALMDIAWLANVFNMSVAELAYRKVVIPEFPIPGVCAALTSEDFVYMRDVEYGVYPFWDPETLTDKYYLHHWAAVGANPAAMCVLFGDLTNSTIPTVDIVPSAFTFSPDAINVAPGSVTQLHYALTGSVSNDSAGLIGVEPDSAIFEVSAANSGTPVPLNSKTFVDEYGRLHVQKSGLTAGDVITVTATATYLDPSGITSGPFTDTLTATIV